MSAEVISSKYMEKFLHMCLELTNEKDREYLLTRILDRAMEFANCDAGTLYLKEDDGLHFFRMVTLSQGVKKGGLNNPIALPPVPLEEKYVCAWAAIHNKSINVKDVHTDTHFDFTGPIKYDSITGYNTKSMLVVPMTNDKGDLIGVLQLINAKDKNGNTIDFDPDIELLIIAIASQAAISITNMKYSSQIIDLLDSLVGALSTAIDERTPYNANHTRNMVKYGTRFLNWLEDNNIDWEFDSGRRRTLLLSIWLHDVGKLAVPLRIMNKSDRLGFKLADVDYRFEIMDLKDEVDKLKGKITEEEFNEKVNYRKEALEFIHRINKVSYLPDSELPKIDELYNKKFIRDGEEYRYINYEEKICLEIRKGTLTDEERRIMESHAIVTSHILDKVKFPRIYAETPKWAAMHHEFLNGKGYPNHLKAKDIPKEVRLITILDIFEALTARDRPYKPAMPLEKALKILREMADEGSLDSEVLDLFLKSEVWDESKYDEEVQ